MKKDYMLWFSQNIRTETLPSLSTLHHTHKDRIPFKQQLLTRFIVQIIRHHESLWRLWLDYGHILWVCGQRPKMLKTDTPWWPDEATASVESVTALSAAREKEGTTCNASGWAGTASATGPGDPHRLHHKKNSFCRSIHTQLAQKFVKGQFPQIPDKHVCSRSSPFLVLFAPHVLRSVSESPATRRPPAHSTENHTNMFHSSGSWAELLSSNEPGAETVFSYPDKLKHCK